MELLRVTFRPPRFHPAAGFWGYPFSGSWKIISVALGAPFGHTFGTFWLMFRLGNDMMGALRAFICLISPISRMTLIIPFSLAASKHMGQFCESECVYLFGKFVSQTKCSRFLVMRMF